MLVLPERVFYLQAYLKWLQKRDSKKVMAFIKGDNILYAFISTCTLQIWSAFVRIAYLYVSTKNKYTCEHK